MTASMSTLPNPSQYEGLTNASARWNNMLSASDEMSMCRRTPALRAKTASTRRASLLPTTSRMHPSLASPDWAHASTRRGIPLRSPTDPTKR